MSLKAASISLFSCVGLIRRSGRSRAEKMTDNQYVDMDNNRPLPTSKSAPELGRLDPATGPLEADDQTRFSR